jgi:GLPGLI family protein
MKVYSFFALVLFPIYCFIFTSDLRDACVKKNPLLANVICLYRMVSRPDSASKNTREEITQLAISDSLSEFRSLHRYKADSLLAKYQYASRNSPAFREGMNAQDNLPRYKFDGVVIKNLRTSNCFYYGIIDKVLYSYQENDYPIKWQLLKDTTHVAGYKCQKAFAKFGGRKYFAWFTRQIPISNGPYKFGGLPGLIVSIGDATNSYTFELIRLYQPRNNYEILLPNQVRIYKQPALPVSKQKYYKSYYISRDNFIEKSLASGLMEFSNEDYVRKTYQEKIKHRNNPIEIE